MLTKHFALLSTIYLYFLTHLPSSLANPLGPITPATSSLSDNYNAEPTCTDVDLTTTANTTSTSSLSGFQSDCLLAARQFFNFPMISQVAWHWKRTSGSGPPQPGYNFLPFSVAPGYCMLKLDILEDPQAEDQFALVQIADDFRRLFTRCVRGRGNRPAAGFVPVGPRGVLKLSVGPTPEGRVGSLVMGGVTVLGGGRNGTEGKGFEGGSWERLHDLL